MAMFLYSCANCGAPARKEPLKADPKWKDAQATKDYKGLGGWTCTNGCGRGVKVKRVFAQQLLKAA